MSNVKIRPLISFRSSKPSIRHSKSSHRPMFSPTSFSQGHSRRPSQWITPSYALSLQLLLEQTSLTSGGKTRTRRWAGSAPPVPGQIPKDRHCPTAPERVGAGLAKPTPWPRRHESQSGAGPLRGGSYGGPGFRLFLPPGGAALFQRPARLERARRLNL